MLNNANLPLTAREKDQIAARKKLIREKPEHTGDPRVDPGDLLTMPALPKQFHGMKSFRQRMAITAAYTSLHKWTTQTLMNVLLSGFDEYVRGAKGNYEGLAFQREDYRLMFDIFQMELQKRNGAKVVRKTQVAFPGSTPFRG